MTPQRSTARCSLAVVQCVACIQQLRSSEVLPGDSKRTAGGELAVNVLSFGAPLVSASERRPRGGELLRLVPFNACSRL